ncbi:LysR family transcriptional regulator [Singulisphaera sp. Ch08]|uniref:LysR family transcriptional regulator n=1 Tax=Singulisphaera sp. Ch08 TaxID=3120278 RepID=A0AAU7CIH8_9BACT
MRNSIRYKDLQLATLRSFCEVATHGNFTEASRRLHLSAPTVWQQVRSLERKLQVTLVRRQGRTVVLSAEGKLLYDLVHSHVAGLDSLVRLFEAGRSELPQQVTIAATPYFVTYHLPQAIQAFVTRYPAACLNFIICSFTQEIFRSVERGEADIGMTVLDHDDSLPASLNYEELFSLSLTLLTVPRHPLARKRTLTPLDLVNFPIIMPPTGGVDAPAIERLLRRHNLTDKIQVVMCTKNFDIIIRYVGLNVGIALCHVGPKASMWMQGVHLREFDPALPKLPAVLVTRKGAHSPPQVQECLNTLRQLSSSAVP